MKPFIYIITWCLLLSIGSLGATASDHLDRAPHFVKGLDEATMMRWCDSAPLQGIEGVWYYPAEDLTMGVRLCDYSHSHNECFIIVVLACENDLELIPGTVMGHIERSAVADKFTLTLYSERDRVTLLRPVETVASLNREGNELTFDPPHWNVKMRVNLARFLPTIFGKVAGVSVVPEIKRERLPIGFKKVYPSTAHTSHIVYL